MHTLRTTSLTFTLMASQPSLISLAQFLNSVLTPKQMNDLVALLNREDALDPEAAPSKSDSSQIMPNGIQDLLKEMEAAYSIDKFPDPSPEESRRIRDQYPGFIDRVSAYQGRHLARQLRDRLNSI